MSSISIGQTYLNQFRVDAFVASGGMGAVYRVWDIKRNVPLAMKVLHSDLADDPSILKRFKREANALKKLAHPNIVPFYGLYQTSEFAFLLERYVDGPSLKEILRAKHGKPMAVNEVLIYLKALSAALGYAHANGVVHCDVKPGNVMIDQGGNIYLTDFGIARHSDSATTTLATSGTVAYMAPEQILGEPVSPATDIYALGILLYEMVTGQRPFKKNEKGTESSGLTAEERIRYGHLTIPPPDPRLTNPALPQSLVYVILKALEKDPLRRYQDAYELFVEACRAADINPELLPDRGSFMERSITTSQIGNTGNESYMEGQASSTPFPTAEYKKQGVKPWVVIGACILVVFFILGGFILVGGGPVILIPMFDNTDTQEVPKMMSSQSQSSYLSTATHSPTLTPLPQETSTPIIEPTSTSSPTPNSDQPWGKIVYTCQVYKDDTRNQVCIINADGTGFRQITNESSNYYPSLAPDGRSVIFVSYQTKHWEIFELDLINNAFKQITYENREYSAPEISPDGKYIIAAKKMGNQEVWTMDRDGGNQYPLVTIAGTDCLDPVWSHDTNKILFACGPATGRQLYRIDKNGGNLKQITNLADIRGRSDWSADGDEIATYIGTEWHREIMILDTNGSIINNLTQGGNNLAPSYSPDGNWITFTSYRDLYGDDNGCEIYIMRVDGTDIRRLTNNGYCDYQPRWGP
jgi:TolB protein